MPKSTLIYVCFANNYFSEFKIKDVCAFFEGRTLRLGVALACLLTQPTLRSKFAPQIKNGSRQIGPARSKN
jgi:hypothetical protein